MILSVIKVQGMSCDHCVKTIERELQTIPGIWHVAVSLKNNTATVKFDESNVALEGIKEAIRHAGYDAT